MSKIVEDRKFCYLEIAVLELHWAVKIKPRKIERSGPWWCVVCVWCVCHYKNYKWCLIGRATGDIVKEVIEVDELDEGSISTAAGKRDE